MFKNGAIYYTEKFGLVEIDDIVFDSDFVYFDYRISGILSWRSSRSSKETIEYIQNWVYIGEL